ncbi:putative TrbI protein [Legionella donaldsonii]|uniref:Putative TrbI protein n=1 Tax=Legionella donaldsonii TaxID=45060 RepID=A0A378KJQ4_9GAMM|nr:type-F conjugative transfer system protein TrbI [Legionella donaldsonii]STX84876.1 putative TrbI protein [Legionella donaldsonii]
MAASRMRQIGLFAFVFFAVLIGSFKACKKPTLYVIDMQRALHQPALLLSRSPLSETEQKALLSAFAKRLPDVIADYCKAHKVTLIAAPVLGNSGENELTDYFIEKTLNEVSQHG